MTMMTRTDLRWWARVSRLAAHVDADPDTALVVSAHDTLDSALEALRRPTAPAGKRMAEAWVEIVRAQATLRRLAQPEVGDLLAAERPEAPTYVEDSPGSHGYWSRDAQGARWWVPLGPTGETVYRPGRTVLPERVALPCPAPKVCGVCSYPRQPERSTS